MGHSNFTLNLQNNHCTFPGIEFCFFFLGSSEYMYLFSGGVLKDSKKTFRKLRALCFDPKFTDAVLKWHFNSVQILKTRSVLVDGGLNLPPSLYLILLIGQKSHQNTGICYRQIFSCATLKLHHCI